MIAKTGSGIIMLWIKLNNHVGRERLPDQFLHTFGSFNSVTDLTEEKKWGQILHMENVRCVKNVQCVSNRLGHKEGGKKDTRDERQEDNWDKVGARDKKEERKAARGTG